MTDKSKARVSCSEVHPGQDVFHPGGHDISELPIGKGTTTLDWLRVEYPWLNELLLEKDRTIARYQMLLETHLKTDKETHTDPGGYDGIPMCPTFYDGCHCTVETLEYNIHRAEKAEKELKEQKEITLKMLEENNVN